jgi:hypothetical protein
MPVSGPSGARISFLNPLLVGWLIITVVFVIRSGALITSDHGLDIYSKRIVQAKDYKP